MATVTVHDDNLTLRDGEAVAAYLSGIGLVYERWGHGRPLSTDASPEEILGAYVGEIERLKARGGYVAADVITVNSSTPGLDQMLAKFKREHWHDEDEVRFIVEGRGLFHVRPERGPVVSIEVEAGDLLCVPRGTLHWFNLCSDLTIKAIRLFTEAKGWAPVYTESGVDGRYQPLCLGHASPAREGV
jgi:1,2-dihydroxy-3-keto-5-methylthiopentene dioxygenase